MDAAPSLTQAHCATQRRARLQCELLASAAWAGREGCADFNGTSCHVKVANANSTSLLILSAQERLALAGGEPLALSIQGSVLSGEVSGRLDSPWSTVTPGACSRPSALSKTLALLARDRPASTRLTGSMMDTAG